MAQLDLTTEESVLKYLQSKDYTCTTVERLSEGVSGFVFRAHLNIPASAQSPTSLIVKHVQNYAARWPEYKIAQDRMDYEAKALFFLTQAHFVTKFPRISAPTLLHYNQTNHTLLMKDAGALPSLKSWLQPTSPSTQVRSIGKSLGSYLAHIHNQTATDATLKAAFNTNNTAKQVSSFVYYAGLPAAAAEHGHSEPFIAAAAKAAEAEVLDSDEVWTLGDFWTGNVLVSAATGEDQSEPSLTVLDLELAKPGTAAFDVGQMAAEMLCLARFRSAEKGGLLLESFLEAYEAERLGGVDAAGVAVRVGAHLVTMMPRAWKAEAGEDGVMNGVEEGVELIRMGWERDEDGLRKSAVGILM
ncbi:hypothetical protein Q7P37_003814 [Cladosporium fusiforme]